MSVIHNIDLLMQEKNLKYSDLAKKLNINRSVISNWINRETDPPAKYIVLICEFLNVDIRQLFYADYIEKALLQEENNNTLPQIYAELTEENKLKISGMIELKLLEQEEIKKAQNGISSNNIAVFPVDEAENEADDRRIIYIEGAVAAGSALEFSDDYDKEEYYPKDDRADYALYVRGDSLEELIPNGSIIEVEKTNYVNNGEIAIVRIDDSATCKRVYFDKQGITLESINPAYEDKFYKYPEADAQVGIVTVLGRVLL